MDISSLISGGSAPGQDSTPAIEYAAQAASPIVSGDVRMAIGKDALIVTALFTAVEVPFAEMNALAYTNHIITISADSGDYSFSRMGSWAQPFYDALFDAYNKAVLRSLFIPGAPLLIAGGDYRHSEDGAICSGSAPIHVYENNVAVLPPDLSARRVPLCFVTGMEKGAFQLTLALDTGESYTYAKLGYDTDSFAGAVEKQIRKLREESLAAAKEIDPSLAVAQASRIASLMPQGAAAPISQLSGISPSFVSALEGKIAATRAAEYYNAFAELCDKSRFWIGFRKNEASTGDMAADGMDELGSEDAAPDPYLLWLIVPSPDGRFAAVEFAEADAATFVYRVNGDFTGFARKINHALEAIDFKREVIRLSDEELRKPENADYYMAMKRTAALQFVRSNFVGRVIHSSPGNWKRKLTELWN